MVQACRGTHTHDTDPQDNTDHHPTDQNGLVHTRYPSPQVLQDVATSPLWSLGDSTNFGHGCVASPSRSSHNTAEPRVKLIRTKASGGDMDQLSTRNFRWAQHPVAQSASDRGVTEEHVMKSQSSAKGLVSRALAEQPRYVTAVGTTSNPGHRRHPVAKPQMRKCAQRTNKSKNMRSAERAYTEGTGTRASRRSLEMPDNANIRAGEIFNEIVPTPLTGRKRQQWERPLPQSLLSVWRSSPSSKQPDPTNV